MMGGEILRIVDTIHRDKEIDKEVIFLGIEAALESAARKHMGRDEAETDLVVIVNRETGEITATDEGEPIEPVALGRIAAQSAKQVMIQKIREAERDVIFSEYEGKIGTIASGTIQRFEGPNIVVSLGKTEGFLPRSEQMPDDSYRIGERIKAFVFDVRKVGQRVKIMLSRTHRDLVRQLFSQEVPEINDQVIEIKVLAREAGYRTKIAVESNDPRVDCVGACVGVRGSRIKNIVEELNGEKIDIIRWSELTEVLIANALKPAEITSVEMDPDTKKATVVVDKEQLSLAIGRRGQNVRLAAKLSGWHIDIVTESEERQRTETLVANLQKIPDVSMDMALSIAEIGYASLDEILLRGAESLLEADEITPELAEQITAFIPENRELFAAVPAVSRTSGGSRPADPFAAAAEKMLAEQQANESSDLDKPSPLDALVIEAEKDAEEGTPEPEGDALEPEEAPDEAAPPTNDDPEDEGDTAGASDNPEGQPKEGDGSE